MNTTTAYTPLESLLLFQSLIVWGTDPDVFIRTSTLLKTNTLIRDGETYDPGRLSPDALRELYLQLLREELRLEATQGEGKGDASPTRKRKLQSPQLPTIKDANEYSEKLPQLVDRLYGRYRDLMIKSIQEDERKYETLQREIAEIERGEWDERILKDDRERSKRTPSVALEESKPTKATGESPTPVSEVVQDGQQTEAPSDSTQTDGQQPQKDPSLSPVPAAPEEPKPEGLAISDVLNSREPSPPKVIEPLTASQTENPPPILPPIGHQRTSSQDKLPGPPPLQPVQNRPAENYRWEQYQGAPLPQQQSPYPANSNYPQFPQPQYPPYPQGPHRGSFSVPPGHGLPPQGHVPSSPISGSHPSPIILPPPNIGRGPGSPGTQHLNQLADAAEQQQYRATSASPLVQQGGVPGAQYGQPYPAYPPQYMNDGSPLTGNGTPPQWNPNYAPPYPPPPNYNYPHPPQPGPQPFSATPNIIQPGQRQYNSPYIPSQGPRPVTGPSSTPRPLHLRGVDSLPHTPTSFGRALNLTGWATRWTPTPTASTPKVPKSPIQPAYEPLSPVPHQVIHPPLKNAKTPKNNAKAKKADAKADASSASQPRIKKQRANKRTKAGSPDSSAIAGSLRSQSVMSHPDELSLVNDATSGVSVKQEAATPRAVEDVGETTAEESKNLRSGTMPASPRRPLKRKRPDSPPREPSGPPTHVLWTRNFPKISASALERIGAHRSASTFAQPIKERDAPGYSNVILRPQDLKSIRAAINSSYKTGHAIASTMGDQGQASMLLPISEDLIPPKGIVNNAQLEKELMRIFSNAIMFNHDPHRSLGKVFEAAQSIEESAGAENYEVDENQLVNDTRAMFTDVEKIVGEMRSAERRQEGVLGGEAEEDEADELAGDADVATGGVLKRRRRA
jgi:Bromodomain